MLDDDTRLEVIGPGRFRGRSPTAGRCAPRTAGYVASYLTRALMHESPVPDPLALNVHFVAPAAPGPATFEVEVLRAGRSHATLQARLFQGELVAVALATFGRRRDGGRELRNLTMPSIPPPEECSPRVTTPVPGLTIGLRFDDRIPPGGHPELGGAGGGTATAGGWKRLLDRELDDLAVPLFLDAWPPSIWGATEAAAGFAPTIDLHGALARDAAAAVAPRLVHHGGSARRLPRRRRRALGLRRHPRRPEPPARPLRRGAPG